MGEEILVVGCGGLGCELVKLLAQDPANTLTLVDDDTIDPTNLNRQFFFTKDDIGKSKSETVARKIKGLMKANSPRVSAISGSIDDFPYLGFYQKFSVVYNCLDNNKTRSFVNQRCYAAGVAMVDGGSAGWLGQSFFNGEECFDCLPKRQEKVYPVCSIRQRPKDFEHCLVWARDIVESSDAESLRNEIAEHAKLEKPAADQNDNEITKSPDQDVSDSSVELLKDETVRMQSTPLEESTSSPANKRLKASAASILLSTADLETGLRLCKDKMRLIYKAALLRASRFGIKPSSFTDSQTFIEKIIPSVCTTNAIVASLMVLSRANKKNYYLVHGSLGIVKASLSRKRSDCLTCSLPVYRCNFPRQASISDLLAHFKAESLADEISLYNSRLDEKLQVLDGKFAIASKNGFCYRIYFEMHSEGLSVKRIK